MKNKKVAISIISAIIVFIAIVRVAEFLYLKNISTNKGSERKILYWVAPMNPNYRRNEPGKSPMGMDLVPVYADNGKDENAIKISPAVENNLGVKISTVKQMPLSRMISTVGYVTADENNIEHIHTYTDGWIKVLNVKTTGEEVKKGQLLLELFSPTLINAQEELILALKYNNASLIRAGKQKLKTLGMDDEQINLLEKTKKIIQNVKIYASQGGIVSHLNVREGKYVKPNTDIMTIEDLSHIWMIVEIFERQANWVKVGQTALANLPYFPGKSWQGKVEYVYPQLDPKTHTLKARLSFPNPDLTIKPEMYVNVKILSSIIQDAIAIPKPALIRTGDGDRIILSLGDGKYKAQVVKVGIESGDYYQILSGLQPGNKVVTSAQFLIDSESNLKAAFNRMDSNSDIKTKMDDMPKEIFGMGKIKYIDVGNRLLTLDHQPIPALNMPAMNMKFRVSKDIDLKNHHVGDDIDFMVIRQGEDSYMITKIMPMKTRATH